MTGTSRPQVLVLTNRRDFSVDWVVRELRSRRVPYLRVNTETLAETRWRIDPLNEAWRMSAQADAVDLSSLRSIYYRRPEKPRMRGLDRSDARLAVEQWKALLDGLWSMPGLHWISHPLKIQAAESKIGQLRRASALGFRVPETIVTNSYGEAVQFAAQHEYQVVAKGLSAPELGPKSAPSFVFTTAVDRERLEQLGDPDPAPILLQRLIAPKIDVRVTVVGGRLFAAQTTSQHLDWRMGDPPPSFSSVDLPGTISLRCLELVDSFGLAFAGIDLVLDGEDWYFLELNPNGEWGWLQHIGIRIAEAITDELVGGYQP